MDSQRAAEATAGSDLQWEDIPDAAFPAPPHAEAASPTQDEGAEGLAAYAADAAFADAPDAAPRGQGSAGAAVGADDAVLEALAGLYRLATTRALPAVQEALRVLVQARLRLPFRVLTLPHALSAPCPGLCTCPDICTWKFAPALADMPPLPPLCACT